MFGPVQLWTSVAHDYFGIQNNSYNLIFINPYSCQLHYQS